MPPRPILPETSLSMTPPVFTRQSTPMLQPMSPLMSEPVSQSMSPPMSRPLLRAAGLAVVLAVMLAVSGCSILRRADTGLPAPFAHALQKAAVPASAVALTVRPVAGHADGSAHPVSHNAQLPFQPASIMKLLTSEAALALLGPDFHWITRVHAVGNMDGDVLRGDLVIEGGGDPRFAHEDLGRLLRALRQLGLREIRGDLILDRSLYQPLAQDAAAFDGQPSRAYNALPDALLLDAHALNLQFRPAADRVQVTSEPPLEAFTITSPLLSGEPCTRLREQLQPVLSAQGLRFAGSYPAACGERDLAFHLHTLDPVAYFDAVFRRMWRELGGSLAGQVRDGRVPAGSRELLAWPSRPLAQVLVDINKQSNNVMARNLMLSLVAERGGKPASAVAASELLLAWMAASGIPSQGTVIENGSGLSRAERMSAATLAALLDYAWQQPTMPELLASLPVAGIDGTMVKRHGDSPVRGRAHIKTGSLAGVASIAGYVTAKSGQRVIVVSMINHANANEARAAFETLLDWVYATY